MLVQELQFYQSLYSSPFRQSKPPIRTNHKPCIRAASFLSITSFWLSHLGGAPLLPDLVEDCSYQVCSSCVQDHLEVTRLVAEMRLFSTGTSYWNCREWNKASWTRRCDFSSSCGCSISCRWSGVSSEWSWSVWSIWVVMWPVPISYHRRTAY
jgi:hypothetical protein